MRITRSELRHLVREEVRRLSETTTDSELNAAIAVPIDRVLRDKQIQDLFFKMMSRVLDLVDVNNALSSELYDEVLAPNSSFQRGVFDAIVDDLTGLITSD